MPTTVTLKVANNNCNNVRNFTVTVENENLLRSIINMDKKSITTSEMKRIQETIARSGDAGILEACDLSPKEKLNLAKINGYNELYELQLSQDGKFYEITIKETGFLYPDPKIYHIKKDFGLKENVFLNNNRNLVGSNPEDPEVGNYDLNKLRAGTKFKIPVNEVDFSSGPCGFWGRLVAIG